MSSEINRYNDVVVKIPIEESEEDGVNKFKANIDQWREEKRAAVWCEVPCSKADKLPKLLELGFKPHHCTDDYFMLTLWLNDQSESKIPYFGTHIVRVEALIIRENPENPFNREILMVKEKNGKDWKLISGNVEPGEFVEQAVVREVKEEVGLDAHFVSILGYGNRISQKMGRNEIFFVCNMSLTDKSYLDSDHLVLQEDEILESKWMNIFDALGYLKGLQKRCLNAAIQKRGLIKFISNDTNAKLHAHFVGHYGNWRSGKRHSLNYCGGVGRSGQNSWT
jgi:8-oxo-dGTP pyrophosphatase MutT (NUDIX family)